MPSDLEDTVCIPYSAADFLYNHKQATYTFIYWLYSNSHQLHKRKKESALFLCWFCAPCHELVLSMFCDSLIKKSNVFFAYITGSATIECISNTRSTDKTESVWKEDLITEASIKIILPFLYAMILN